MKISGVTNFRFGEENSGNWCKIQTLQKFKFWVFKKQLDSFKAVRHLQMGCDLEEDFVNVLNRFVLVNLLTISTLSKNCWSISATRTFQCTCFSRTAVFISLKPLISVAKLNWIKNPGFRANNLKIKKIL